MRLNAVRLALLCIRQCVEKEGGRVGSSDHDVAAIDLDDLTSPRLTDVQRQILEFTEARPVEIDIDAMLAEAVEQAGGRRSGRHRRIQ